MINKREVAKIIIVVLGLVVLTFTLGQVSTLADAPLAATSEDVDEADVSALANGPAFGMQYRGFSGQSQQLLDIEASGSTLNSRPVFPVIGGVFGLAFIEDTLYGAECDNPCGGTNDYYLVTLSHVGTVSGARVGATPIGFSNVEGLAYCPSHGKLYGTSFNFSTHLTTLISINPTTGVGAAVGTLSRDVWIVGLACHPATGILYGISSPFATNTTPKLYTIDKTSGNETSIGLLGVALQGLAWDDDLDRLIGGFEKLYAINTTTGVATLIGGNFATGTTGDGVYGLAYPVDLLKIYLPIVLSN